MKQISAETARDYINGGLAGFYAYRAQSPIVHKETMCVFADRRWWLIENGEFQVEDQGILILPNSERGWSRVHKVDIDGAHPICEHLLADQRNDAGPHTNLPVSLILDNMPGRPIGKQR